MAFISLISYKMFNLKAYEDGTFVLAKTISISTVCVVNVGEALGHYYASRMTFALDKVYFVLDLKLTMDAFTSHC